MKIFDCTTYFEENMMMEIRFNVLNQYVDKFIVCEANYSHSGAKKKINFNKNNYPEFKEKIVHLILEKEPSDINKNSNSDPRIIRSNSVKRINYQRDYIIKGLEDAKDEDLVMYSDNDEIPDFTKINKNELKKNKIIIFKQKMFYYKLNLQYPSIDWYGTKCCKFKHLNSISLLREIKPKKYSILRPDIIFSKVKYNKIKIIDEGGWHFSNLKTPQELMKKYMNDEMHAEFEGRNISIKEIERLVKEKKINYNHFINSKNIERQFSEFNLKKINKQHLPGYLDENYLKYSKWFD